MYICGIMKELWHRQLRKEASLHHMCEENRSALEAADSKAAAIRLYKKTIDWALEEGYPDIATLREHFADCGGFGIYVDKEFHGEILDEHQVYVFHNCSGTIRTGLNVEKRIIPMMYFANGCDMDVRGIRGSGRSVRVPLYVFGQNRISAEQSEDIQCLTYKFDAR